MMHAHTLYIRYARAWCACLNCFRTDTVLIAAVPDSRYPEYVHEQKVTCDNIKNIPGFGLEHLDVETF